MQKDWPEIYSYVEKEKDTLESELEEEIREVIASYVKKIYDKTSNNIISFSEWQSYVSSFKTIKHSPFLLPDFTVAFAQILINAKVTLKSPIEENAYNFFITKLKEFISCHEPEETPVR